MNDMHSSDALDVVGAGIAMLLAQGVIATSTAFTETEIRKYLNMRKRFHKTFSQACLDLANEIEMGEYGDKVDRAVRPLRDIARVPAKNVQMALRKTTRLLVSLGRFTVREVPFALARLLRAARIISGEEAKIHKEELGYPIRTSSYEELLKNAIRLDAVPNPVKTLFRKVLKVGFGTDMGLIGRDDVDAGAWFEMDPATKVAIRAKIHELQETRRNAKGLSLEEWTAITDQISELQAKAGVNLTIVERKDQVPLQQLLKEDKSLTIDAPTSYIADRLTASLVERYERQVWNRKEYGRKMTTTKTVLNRLLKQISNARRFTTLERIVQEAVDRRELSEETLEDLRRDNLEAGKNKALRDGLSLSPLSFEPISRETFMDKNNVRDVTFYGDGYTLERQEEILGQVDASIEHLSLVFGKGFMSRLPTGPKFFFEEGIGATAKASYSSFTREGPKLTFGPDWPGVLAHEMSHFFDEMINHKASKELGLETAFGGREVYTNVFGNTGQPLHGLLKSVPRAAKLFPEIMELVETVVETPDYDRWHDMIPNAVFDDDLPQAIREYSGMDYYNHPLYGHGALDKMKYWSDLENNTIVTRTMELYRERMDGDDRKLSYTYSGVEVWARLCEQYVYTKLSRAGIANPWLTRINYDDHRFVEEKTFETKIEPILDRLFASLKSKGVFGRLLDF